MAYGWEDTHFPSVRFFGHIPPSKVFIKGLEEMYPIYLHYQPFCWVLPKNRVALFIKIIMYYLEGTCLLTELPHVL